MNHLISGRLDNIYHTYAVHFGENSEQWHNEKIKLERKKKENGTSNELFEQKQNEYNIF